MVDLTYPNVTTLIERQLKRHPTESRAFLAWFMENIYRLEEGDADDCVCDGPGDKGIDGIFLNETSEVIEVFQSKLYQNNSRNVGDKVLREFAGSLQQFRDHASVENMKETTTNIELKGRIDELRIADLVGSGYEVRGAFISNGEFNPDAQAYLSEQGNIIAFGASRIDDSYISPERDRPNSGPFTFDVSRNGFLYFNTPSGVEVVMTPISATQLIRLPGIQSGELFEPNVRQSLGRTKVNKEISNSIALTSEHPNFVLYHNGITMVCEELYVREAEKEIDVDNIFVVNGCQSLSSLHDASSSISDDLAIPVRIVKIGKDTDLLEKITHRSNNQNAIKARDFKSNNAIQVRLQNEFREVYGGKYFYSIKRGEVSASEHWIDNELAAKLLLSFDLEQPYTAHQSYKLFDELYNDIFSRGGVDAYRIVMIYTIFSEVEGVASQIEDQGFANYNLSKFFLVYAIGRALRTSDFGVEFVKNPKSVLADEHLLDVFRLCIRAMLDDLVTDLNGELRERAANGEPIDFKRELKSASEVAKLSRSVVDAYEKLVRRGRMPSFEDDWNLKVEAISTRED